MSQKYYGSKESTEASRKLEKRQWSALRSETVKVFVIEGSWG